MTTTRPSSPLAAPPRRRSAGLVAALVTALLAVAASEAVAAPGAPAAPAAAVAPAAPAAAPTGVTSAALALPAVSTHRASEPVPARADARALPSERRWLRRVRGVLHGSRARLARVAARAAGGDRSAARLAITLDVDNTALATTYDRGQPVRPVLRLARSARRHGIAVLVNTGRRVDRLPTTAHLLEAAGYRIDRLCGREVGEPLVAGKLRCRSAYVAAGYRVVANVGNRPTDFAGDGYGRAYRLPHYGGRLS